MSSRVRISPADMTREVAIDLLRRASMSRDDLWVAANRLVPNPDVDVGAFIEQCRSAGLDQDATEAPVEPTNYWRPILARHVLARWAGSGLSIFELTHSFMAALALTDPSSIAASELRLPFSTFRVRLPVPFWMFSRTEDGAPEAPVNALWVHSFIGTRGTTDEERAEPEKLLLVVMLGSTLRTREEGILLLPDPSAMPGRLGDWLSHRLVIRSGSEDRHVALATVRVVANLCLYLAQKPVQEPGPKRAQRGRGGNRLEQAARPQVWTLGREVKLRPELIDAAKAWINIRPGNRSGWALRSRFVVSGHWRPRQVCGTRVKLPDGRYGPWLEHRRVWIEPYWKGPKGEIVQRVALLGHQRGK